MNFIVIRNEMNETEAEHLWLSPECLQRAEIKNKRLYLYCGSKNICIFAAVLDLPDSVVKGIKFNQDNTIKLTI